MNLTFNFMVFLGLLAAKASALECYACTGAECLKPNLEPDECDFSSSEALIGACVTRYNLEKGIPLMKGCRTWSNPERCLVSGPSTLKTFNCFCFGSLCNDADHKPDEFGHAIQKPSNARMIGAGGPGSQSHNSGRGFAEAVLDENAFQCYSCIKDCSNPEKKPCKSGRNACITQKDSSSGEVVMKGCKTWTKAMDCSPGSSSRVNCHCDSNLCNDEKHGL